MFKKNNEKNGNTNNKLEDYVNIESEDITSKTSITEQVFDIEKVDESFKEENNISDSSNSMSEPDFLNKAHHNDLFIEDVMNQNDEHFSIDSKIISNENNEKDTKNPNAIEMETESAGDSITADILGKVEGIGSLLESQYHSLDKKLNQLSYEFEQKLKHDEHKEKIIDKLHNELQGYKDNLIHERLMPVIMDLILTIDRSMKLKKSLDSGEEYTKHLKAIDGTIMDIEDILYTQGVESYESEDSQFQKMEQKIVRTIKTNDLSKDKQIAEVLGKGYKWDERIIRKEQVSVYVYEEKQEDFN